MEPKLAQLQPRLGDPVLESLLEALRRHHLDELDAVRRWLEAVRG